MEFTAAAELPGSKIGTFASMVSMMEAQLELSLEDITGPIDLQKVHELPAPRTTLSPASNHLGLGQWTLWPRRDKKAEGNLCG
jgi:hypothetical protein